MPERFQRDLTRLEQTFVRQALAQYQQIRPALGDAIEANSPPSVFEQVLTGLKAALRSLASSFAGQIDALLDGYLARQLDELRQQDASIASTEVVLTASQAQRQQVMAQWVENSGDFIGAIVASFRAAAFQVQDDDEAEKRARLTALKITNGRASEFRRGKNTLVAESQRLFWTAAMSGLGILHSQTEEQSGVKLEKALRITRDERTTETCLRVAKQRQPIGKPFRLTGSPRFSDEMQRPPFHHRCRTVPRLVIARA